MTAAAKIPAFPYLSASAALVDIDHDGDLDIFVAGLADGGGKAPAPSLLLQNNGDGTFTDITAEAQLGGAGPRDRGRPHRLRQPPRRRPVRAARRRARPLQEHARRHVQDVAAEVGPARRRGRSAAPRRAT